ncbi:hypothetical protein LTS14_003364 [Recurvomyces mirabilis]|uniref:uncharacterized protein n=1 Tax=Recurvomyces mirabilis TaxID=574656 RepID=UPI002DDE9A68|nr:hypothetical protein LTS14_003364 [Recurvomyces mirabilis]
MPTDRVPLDIVVRFSTSTPDVILNVPHPSTTSVVSLKLRIRSQLSAPASESRLRLIHAGKVLVDASALSQSLHGSAPPPIARSDEEERSKSEKAKGKQPQRDQAQEKKAVAVRVYVHCAIGDFLPVTDLAIEARQAQEADEALRSQSPTANTTTTSTEEKDASTTTPAPRGFDRLLTAGFTAPEIATLRTQFLAIQAHTHTPDTMPSGPALLALEEEWLDNGSNAAAAPGEAGGFEGEDAGGLDDMLGFGLGGDRLLF